MYKICTYTYYVYISKVPKEEPQVPQTLNLLTLLGEWRIVRMPPPRLGREKARPLLSEA